MTTFDQQPRASQAPGYNLLLPSHHQQQASVLHELVREVVLPHPDSGDVYLYNVSALAAAKNCSSPPHDRKLHEGVLDTEETRGALSDMVGEGGDFSFYLLVTECSDEERALFIARDAFSRRVTLIDKRPASMAPCWR